MKKSHFDEYHWKLLARLLERQYNLKDALQLLDRYYPDNDFIKEMIVSLDNGIPFKQLLRDNSFERELAFYCDYLPLPMAIKLVSDNKEKKKKMINEIVSATLYQFILLLCAFGLLFLFSHFIYPAMTVNLDLNNSTVLNIGRFYHLANIFQIVTLIIFGVIGVFSLYVKGFKRETYLWSILHKGNYDRIIKKVVTYSFVIKLNALLQQGIDIVTAVNIIRHDRKDALVAMLSCHFDECLLAGENFEDSLDMAFFDDQFHSLCLLGLKGDDFIQALSDYQNVVEFRFQRLIKRLTTVFKVICYLFVAMVLISGYQLMLMPLELLELM